MKYYANFFITLYTFFCHFNVIANMDIGHITW